MLPDERIAVTGMGCVSAARLAPEGSHDVHGACRRVRRHERCPPDSGRHAERGTYSRLRIRPGPDDVFLSRLLEDYGADMASPLSFSFSVHNMPAGLGRRVVHHRAGDFRERRAFYGIARISREAQNPGRHTAKIPANTVFFLGKKQIRCSLVKYADHGYSFLFPPLGCAAS